MLETQKDFKNNNLIIGFGFSISFLVISIMALFYHVEKEAMEYARRTEPYLIIYTIMASIFGLAAIIILSIIIAVNRKN